MKWIPLALAMAGCSGIQARPEMPSVKAAYMACLSQGRDCTNEQRALGADLALIEGYPASHRWWGIALRRPAAPPGSIFLR
jgi:hypothetical protein